MIADRPAMPARPAEPTAATPGRWVLAESQRLSQSHLWTLQRRFFADRGLRAWGEGIVPHYISSNPFLARAYARIVLGFLRDWRQQIDPAEPVYIVELGAGAGRLGYHFLKQFASARELPVLKDLRLTYVLTDFSDSQLAELARQPRFEPFITGGTLDFARFDADAPDDLRLLHSGEVLAPGTVRNPVVVVANYFFDSIPQDVFRVEAGELQEGLVTLSTLQEEPDREDPALLARVQLEYSYAPLASPDYYPEPAFNQVLAEYARSLDATYVLFPCAALRCCDHFRKLSGDRLLLLTADRGYIHEDALLSRDAPLLSVHGSFSLSVNYHAVGQYFRGEGGLALHARRRQPSLRICAFATGRTEEESAEMRHASLEALEAQGPDDFFTIKKGLETAYEALSLDQILAFLRFSGWDAHIFSGAYPQMMALAPEADAATRQELCWAARNIWDLYLPIGEAWDLPFYLGMLMTTIDYLPEALQYFTHSLDLYGPDAATFYNLGVCHARQRQLKSALQSVEAALELKPDHAGARNLRIKIQAELGG